MRVVVSALLALLIAPDPRQLYVARYAVDGDTLDVAGVGRVRLLGIDAPEMGRGFDTSAPFAREARDRLASLVAGRYVRIELDVEPQDRYSRTLAYVIRADGLFVNAEIVRSGLARVSARQPLRRLDELRRAEAEAQAARRGMWGAAPAIDAPPRALPRRRSRTQRPRRAIRPRARSTTPRARSPGTAPQRR